MTGTRGVSAATWRSALQASELHDHGSPAVFEQFCSSRLRGEGGHVFGTLEPSAELKAIVARATVLRRETAPR